MVFLMLLPGEESLAEDFSASAGGSDLSDAIGHVILFGIMALLWQHVHRRYYPKQSPAFVMAAAIVLGAALEAAQIFVPFRGVTFLDASANVLGVVGCWFFLQLAGHRIDQL